MTPQGTTFRSFSCLMVLSRILTTPALPCANPPSIPNGNATYSDDVYAIYECDVGYVMESVDQDIVVLLCNASSGEWSGSSPDCNRIQCPNPAVPNFGSVEGSGRHYGDIITFTCETNYRLLHPELLNPVFTSMCTQYGSWSQETPECFPDLDNPDVCPSGGWNYDNRTCFMVTDANREFGEAQQLCASTPFGQLAKIPDQSTQDFIAQNLQSEGRSDFYWIGAFEGLKWYWQGSDTEIEYFSWAAGQPNGPLDSSNCIQLRDDPPSEFYDYDWHDLDCTSTDYFICEVEQSCPAPDSDLASYTQVPFGNNCAVFVRRELRWSDARNYCADRGGRMVEIRNEVLQDILVSAANAEEGSPPNWWIGGFKDKADDQLVFLDGPAVVNSFWSPDEPNRNAEVCIDLDPDNNFRWNDDRCGYDRGYLCQYPGKRGPVQCSDPGTPAHGTSNPSHSDWLFGSYVTFSCDEGYELQGAMRIDCGQNGSYSGIRPECIPVSCDPLFPTLPDSDPYPPSTIEYRSLVVYLCRVGYYPTGDVTSVCQADGTWSQPSGSCEEIPETTQFMSTESDITSLGISTTPYLDFWNATTSYSVSLSSTNPSSDPGNTTTPNPDDSITVQCGYFSMTVTIPLKLVVGVTKGEDLHLELDANCTGVISDNEHDISITTNLTDCGNTIEVDDSLIVYSNTVVERKTDLIARLPEVHVPFSCSYNRSGHVGAISYTLNSYKLNLTEVSTGKYAFLLDIFKDEDFTDKYDDSDYPVDVGLNEDLYFGASVPSQEGTLDLSIRSCVATPSASYNDVQWMIIQDGCAVETSTHITGDHGFVGVTMNTFRFVDIGTRVYIHCDLLACRVTTGNETSECDLACLGTSGGDRFRRDVIEEFSLERKRITKGPLRLPRSAHREESFDMFELSEDSSSFVRNFNPWILILVAMTALCILLIGALFIFLRAMTSYDKRMKLAIMAERETKDTIQKI